MRSPLTAALFALRPVRAALVGAPALAGWAWAGGGWLATAEAGVLTANGSGFGTEGFIRLSYATKIKQIDEALDRIQKALAKLPGKR